MVLLLLKLLHQNITYMVKISIRASQSDNDIQKILYHKEMWVK